MGALGGRTVVVAESLARLDLLSACSVVFVLAASRGSKGPVSELAAHGTLAQLRERGALPADCSELASAVSAAVSSLHAPGSAGGGAREVALCALPAAHACEESAPPAAEPPCGASLAVALGYPGATALFGTGLFGAAFHLAVLGSAVKTVSDLSRSAQRAHSPPPPPHNRLRAILSAPRVPPAPQGGLTAPLADAGQWGGLGEALLESELQGQGSRQETALILLAATTMCHHAPLHPSPGAFQERLLPRLDQAAGRPAGARA